jgi:hypothetical protein
MPSLDCFSPNRKICPCIHQETEIERKKERKKARKKRKESGTSKRQYSA